MRWHTKPVRQIIFMIVVMGIVVAFQNGVSTNIFNVYNSNQYLDLIKSRAPIVAQAIDKTGLVKVAAITNTTNNECFDVIIRTAISKTTNGYAFSPHILLYSPAGIGGGIFTVKYTSTDGKSHDWSGQPVWDVKSDPVYDLTLQTRSNDAQIAVEEGKSTKASYKVKVNNCPFPNESQLTCNYQVIKGSPVVSGIEGSKCECTGKYCNTPETIIRPATSISSNLILNFAVCGKEDLCARLQKNTEVMVNWEKDNINTSSISKYTQPQGSNPVRFTITIDAPSVDIDKITKLSLFIDNVLYILKQ